MTYLLDNLNFSNYLAESIQLGIRGAHVMESFKERQDALRLTGVHMQPISSSRPLKDSLFET